MKTAILALILLFALLLSACGDNTQSNKQKQSGAQKMNSKGVVTRAVSLEEEQRIKEQIIKFKEGVDQSAGMPGSQFSKPPAPPKISSPKP